MQFLVLKRTNELMKIPYIDCTKVVLNEHGIILVG